MALILVRGENNSKLLNAIADMERHGNLTLISKPKVIDASFADSLVESILNSKLRTKSNVATAFQSLLETAKSFQGYQSHRAENEGMIDYKIKGKGRHIKNEKLNSYVK